MAVGVGENLKLDVPRALDEPLDVERPVAERSQRLAACLRNRGREASFVAHDFHPDAAAAFRRLQQQGKADAAGRVRYRSVVLPARNFARNHRRTCLARQLPRGDLGAHGRDDLRRRADEGDPVRCAGSREIMVLREEPVARMDCVGVRGPRRGHHGVDGEVALGSVRRPDSNCAIGKHDVLCPCVGVRVDRNRLDAQLPACTDDANSNLAAVGDQNALEGGHVHRSLNTKARFLRELRVYILKTPNFGAGIGALNAAEIPRASASRVRAGSRIPSSQIARGRVVGRAFVLVLLQDRAADLVLLVRAQLLPLARSCSRLTVASTDAACSPPITEMRALGHIQRNRGS